MVSIQVEATPMIGFESASSSKPIPFSCARAAARAGPSTSWRELWGGWRPAMGGREAYPGRVAGGRGGGLGVGRACGAARILRVARPPLGAGEARALPLAEAPEVALGLARVDLAARQVQVRLGDQAPLVALERHPLGQDVVGVGEARRAVRTRLVRELDAVLVEQPAGLREVCEDRIVRVDQVGVGHAAEVAARVSGDGAGRLATPHAQEAEVAVHRPLLLVDAGAQELAGALLRTALTTGVVAAGLAAAARLLAGAARVHAPVQPRQRDLPEQGEHDDRGGAQRDGHRGRPALPGAARSAREEDDAAGVPRDLLDRAPHLRLPPAGLGDRRHRRPHAVVQLAAEELDEALLVLGDIDVALGDQLLAGARSHAEELHRTDYARGAAACRRSRAPDGERCRRPNTSTGPAPAPSSRRPSRTASEAIARAARAASSGAWPSARCAARALEWVQPDPWAAPSRWRGPVSSSSVSPSKKTSTTSSRCPPVTTTARGPRACSARASAAPSPSPSGRSASTRASGRLGVITEASGSTNPGSAPRASSSSSTAPDSATITGSTTIGVPRSRSPSASRTARTVSAVPSMPIFTASTPMSPTTWRTCSTIISGGTGCTALTPVVFCAVSAVIAVMP